ncbi:MAG: hypothetical protein WD355_08735 [Balneolaceae bacterium]
MKSLLIPYDINTTGLRNPYLFQLLRALEFQPEPLQIQHGFGWLKEERGKYDVIHLHWPEELVNSMIPGSFSEEGLTEGQIESLLNLLLRWKERGSALVLTVHNEQPHKNHSAMSRELYRRIFGLADLFIHMGEESVNRVAALFPEESAGKPYHIIPHGDYSIFPDTISRAAAREQLRIHPDQPVMLTFGAIRSSEELDLGIDAFKKGSPEDSLYLIAGKIPYPYRSDWRHFTSRRKLFLNRGRVRTVEAVIPPEEVQLYLNASDLLFIPRFRALNSGNVALGFTFGKVVAGPEYGVIGEMLQHRQNPVFNPDDPASVAAAVREGFRLAGMNRGEENRSWCREYLGWERLASLYMDAYREAGS